MKILYITRKFPPSVGGMEMAAYELHRELSKSHQVKLLRWGGSNKMLPLVYPWLAWRALLYGLLRRPDLIYLQDGVLSPMGAILKFITRKPTIITVHGLDATFPHPFYQAMIRATLGRNSHIVAVSTFTRDEIRRRFGVQNISVITAGVNDTFYLNEPREALLSKVAARIGLPAAELRQRKIMLTTGRLVKRKGVQWCIESVMPQLAHAMPEVLYLVVGGGRDKEAIEQAIARHNLGSHVKMLGRIPDETRNMLYNAADVFLMPNIPVKNNMEGFGLVALEASSCGTTVIASELEGITDAVQNGQNGYLLPSQDAERYVAALKNVLTAPLPRPMVRDFTLKVYSWNVTAERYEAIMQQLIRPGK